MVQSTHGLWHKSGLHCKLCLLLGMTLHTFLNHVQSLDPNLSNRAMITHVPHKAVVRVK